MAKIFLAFGVITCGTLLFLHTKANKLTIDDVFISVSTYENHELSILTLILNTWYPMAVNQTWFFTNYVKGTITALMNNSTTKNNHFILANCMSQAPYDCCKMAAALNSFLVVMSKEPVNHEVKMLLKKNGTHYFYEKTDFTAPIKKKKKRNRKNKKSRKGKLGKKHKSKKSKSIVDKKMAKFYTVDAQSLEDEVLFNTLKYKNRHYEQYLRKIRALPEVGHLDEIGPAFEVDADYEAREEPLVIGTQRTHMLTDEEGKKLNPNATDTITTEKSLSTYDPSSSKPDVLTEKTLSIDTTGFAKENDSQKDNVRKENAKTFMVVKKTKQQSSSHNSTSQLYTQKQPQGDMLSSIFNSEDTVANKGTWANTYRSGENEVEEEIENDAEALIHPENKVKIYAKDPKWFCHFDDRTYVNVHRLVSVLQRFNYLDEWYLGKKHRNVSVSKLPSRRKKYRVKKIFYSSNTAGFCLSLGMIHKIKHYIRGDRFNQFCAAYDLKDDAALGFIIIHLLKIELFNLPEFHARKEHIKFKPMQSFRDQVSFSFKEAYTFQSVHCFLYPRTQYCKTPQMQQALKDMFTDVHFHEDDDDDDDKYDDDEEEDDD